MKLQSIRPLISNTLSNWNEINAPRLGAALAFYTTLSIAPLMVVCIGIAGIVFGHDAAQGGVLWQVEHFIGPEGSKAVQSLLLQSSATRSGIIATVSGLVMLLFGASGVVGELRDSLNLVWRVKSPPGGLWRMVRYRFVSFAMVLGIGFLLMVSMLLSAAIAAAGKLFSQYLPQPESLLQFESSVASFLTITLLFAILYKVMPDARIEWGDVAIGAVVTAFLFSVGKFLIGLYLGKAGVGSAYGAAGSVVVFLVWVYYSAQIFFLGAEFTHTFAEREGSRAWRSKPTPARESVRKPEEEHVR